MQENSCAIVRDLLTLYVEDVCSKESKVCVEAHIENCPECREAYNAMRETVSTDSVQAEDISVVQALRALRKSMTRRRIMKLAVLGILIVALIVSTPVAYQELCLIDRVSIPASQLDSYSLSVTSWGEILYSIDSHSAANKWGREAKVEVEDDKAVVYLTATRPLLDLPQMDQADPWKYALGTGIFVLGDGKAYSDSQDGPPFIGEDGVAYVPDEGERVPALEISAIYVGIPEDRILVWDRSIQLPHSSQEDEHWNKPSYDIVNG